MPNSLILAGFELLGGATPYSLAKGTFDLGVAEPNLTVISNLFTDGDTISGTTTKSRPMRFTVLVRPSTNRQDLSSQVDALMSAVNVEPPATFTLQWTPTGGWPIVYDCSRATAQRHMNILQDDQLVAVVELSFLASPHGRSTDAQMIAAATSTLQLDSYATAPTGAVLNTTTKFEGTGSATVTLNRIGITNAYTRTVSRAISQNLSTFGGATLRVYNNGTDNLNGTLTLTLTLVSTGGSTSYTTAVPMNSSNVSVWQLAAWAFPTGVIATGTGVDLTAVTSYSILVSYSGTMTGTIHPTLYLDDLRATPAAAPIISTTHGGVVLLPALVGSARTPVNMTLTNGSTIAAAVLHSPPSTQDPDLGILTALSTASTNQTVTIAAANARFNGTYSVLLGVPTGTTGTVAMTVTVTQKENGVVVASQAIIASYTAPLSAGVVPVGDVSLPLRAVPADSTTTSFDVQVQITGTDRVSDLMLLDTRGQTVIADPATATAAIYIDVPIAAGRGSGIYAAGTTNDRTSAYGIKDTSTTTGGPVNFEPGNNKILAWVPTNAPIVTASYYPRWLDERIA